MQTKNILLATMIVLGGVILFSGCDQQTKNSENNSNINQERVVNPQNGATPNTQATPVAATGTLITPDPGNSEAGKAIKEVDALLGGVSADDYSATTLDENELLAD